jgi:NarL family two-component system response regulator LiaR
MIVEDHALMRMGLNLFVSTTPDLELVAEAYSGEQALRLMEEARPDVVLMDLRMPGMGGVAAIRAIRRRYPRVQILALTTYSDEGLILAATQAGAIGYLLKDVPPEDLAEAVRAAAEGRITLASGAARVLMQSMVDHPAPAVGSNLTPREREVLGLLVEGLSNPQIARQLSIGASTVSFHVGNILSKLDAANRAEAAALAVQHDLLY